MKKGRVDIKYILIFLMLIGGLSVFGQKESAIWYFGKNAGLDFREHFPLPLTDGKTDTSEGVASVSDSLGNLIFYTDGRTIWNSSHIEIATGLSGDSTSTQAATILPSRSNPKKFFVFTTKSIVNPEDDNYGGNYYIVDFTNNPSGAVIYNNAEETGVPGILRNSTEKFTAVPFMDEVSETETVASYRILMHEWENNSFAHFKLDSFKLDSLVRDYREQILGSHHLDSVNDDGSHGGASGYIKMSMQGDRVAVAMEGERRFEVYNFDKETGELSNPIFLMAGDRIGGKTEFIHMAYGVEFSPSGRFLYGSSKDGGWIYQWDLAIRSASTMRASVDFVRSNPEQNCGALQLAPNGKIYIAMEGADYLGVINSPNNLGKRCDFVEYGARLLDNDTNEGGKSGLGLPVAIATGAKAEAFYYNHTCLGEKTSFFITNRTGLNYPFFAVTKWETGDFVANVSSQFDVDIEDFVWEHTFAEPGDYKVVLTAIRGGSPVEFTQKMTIQAPPELIWPQDTVICTGQTLDLDAGNGAFYDWVDAGARDRHLLVDFLGNNPVTGVEYPAKEFRVAVTHYNGCVTWDTINVVRKIPPNLSYETTEALCNKSNGSATVIPNGAIEDFIYRWEDFTEETSNRITGVDGGDYGVFVQSIETGCESYIEIPVNAQGTVRIVPSIDTLVCPGTEITLTAENANFFDWEIPDEGNDEFVVVYPMVTTEYRVQGTSFDGEGLPCITTASYTVEVAPENIPDLGADRAACLGDTIWIDAPDNYLDYSWDNGMTGQSIMLTQDVDKLSLFVQDTNYCTFQDDISVTFHEMPIINVTTSKALCGKMDGSAAVVPEGNPDDYIFFWEDFPENNKNKIFDVGAGIYKVQVSSILTGCDTLLEVTVSEFGAPDIRISASIEGPVCPGTEITLTAENADYYIWDDPDLSRTEQIIVSPYSDETYTVMGATIDDEGNECRSYQEITIPVLPYYKPDLGPDLEACEGDVVAIEGEDHYLEWQWSNGLTGQFIELQNSIPELVLNAIDENQCLVKDTMSVTFHPYPSVYLGEDETVCTNEPIILQGGTGDTYLWNNGETSQSISVIEKGIYWLEIETAGCSSRDSLSLQLVNPDMISIDSVAVRDISCFGEIDGEIEIYATGSGDTYAYSIDGGLNYFDNEGLFEALPMGDSYMVSVLEDSVCSKDYNVPLTISEPSEISASYQLTSPTCEGCLDGQIEITLIDGGSPPFNYLWDNQDTEIVRRDVGTGNYSVNITDSRGCFMDLDFILDLSYRIPNAFTPNDDGINDYWTIGIVEYHPDVVVRVYDAKGYLVFESDRGYPEPWDGKLDGEYVPMGSYYYLIYLTDEDKPEKGTVTIIR